MVGLLLVFGAAWASQERDAVDDDVQERHAAEGPSADLNVLTPALRHVEAGQAEVAAHLGAYAGGGATFTSTFSSAGPVTAVRAGWAPVDRLWLDVRAGYGAPVDQLDLGLGLAYGTASYALVDGDVFRTGPNLAAGFLAVDAVAFGSAGWTAVLTPAEAISFDLTGQVVVGKGSPSEPTVLPYWEAGLTVHPEDSPHSVRLGLAAVAPTAAYRYEQDGWFTQVHATGLFLGLVGGAEAGVEVGRTF